MKNTNILVTGASGFIGIRLCQRLINDGANLTLLVRMPLDIDNSVRQHVFSSLEDMNVKQEWFEGVDIVIHLAARVHQMNANLGDELALQLAANRDASVILGLAARDAGVKQFIYLSSIKVNGEHTEGRAPFSESDTPIPCDPYGNAKWAAEQSLTELAESSDMGITIIRPPLVYGPDVKANFQALLRIVSNEWPLPFALINNSRSMVSIDNLVDFIAHCCRHRSAIGRTFVVSDEESLSTASLVKLMANAQNKKSLLFPLPIWLLKILGFLVGRSSTIDRLIQSLEVDSSKAKKILGWQAPASTEEEFSRYGKSWVK